MDTHAVTMEARRQGGDGLRPAALRRLLPAAVVIWAERAFAAEIGWTAAFWLGWTALALTGVLGALPGGLRIALFAALILTSAAAVLRAAIRIALPRRQDVFARLDRGGGLLLGSTSFTGAAPAAVEGDIGAALWRRAQADAARRPPRIGLPRPQLSGDLRAALVGLSALTLLGLVLAGREAPSRLERAFSPWAVPLTAYSFRGEVAPPDYAPGPARQFELTGGGTRAIELLSGGRIEIERLAGPGDWHILSPAGTRVDPAFVPRRGGVWRIVTDGGRTLAALRIGLASDGVPEVRFDGDPVRNATGALSLGYRLTDDHGTLSLALEVSGGRAPARTYSLAEAIQPGTGRVFADLSADPRAGERARLTLIAADGAGNIGRSPPLLVELPVKTFTDPVARRIIAIRKRLMQGDAISRVVRDLTEIAVRPESFDERTDIFVGLRSAAWRLLHSPEETARPQVTDILWDVASDLEDGGTSRALEDLRAAMERLMQQADSGDDELLAELTRQLENAMGEYLRRQIEAAMKAGEVPPAAAAMQNMAPSVDTSFLQAMMEDLKDRLAAGDTKGAQQALQNLRGLMESIQFGASAPDPQAAMRAEAMREAADKLRQAEAQQGQLRDDTIAEAVRQAIREDEAMLEALGGQQEEIGEMVGAAAREMEALGAKVPGELGEARAAMRAAARALGDGDAATAAQAQSEALRKLGEASDKLQQQAEQMARQAAGGLPQPGQSGSGVDPLGRPGQGFGMGNVTIPDEQRMRRVQEIRRILEERAADPSRSEAERSYYLRLLKRF